MPIVVDVAPLQGGVGGNGRCPLLWVLRPFRARLVVAMGGAHCCGYCAHSGRGWWQWAVPIVVGIAPLQGYFFLRVIGSRLFADE
jgi:hypothetical protein